MQNLIEIHTKINEFIEYINEFSPSTLIFFYDTYATIVMCDWCDGSSYTNFQTKLYYVLKMISILDWNERDGYIPCSMRMVMVN